MNLLQPGTVEGLAVRLKRSIRRQLVHRAHRLEAEGVLERLRKTKGVLDHAVRSKCDAYAIDVLGDRKYAPWLYVYSTMAGKFNEGWIPDNYYGTLVVEKLKGDYGRVSSLKPLNSAFFPGGAFPDLLAFVNGLFFDGGFAPVPAAEVSARLFSADDKVVFKRDHSFRGLGIHFFTRQDFDVDTIARLGNGLFQSFIEQHDTLASFSPGSVATLRITTLSSAAGKVSTRAAYLRLGVQGETHVRSRTAIKVPIDLATGALREVGYTPGWTEVVAHPDTRMRFAGHVYPNFREARELVERLHARVPYVRCVGWDVAVDKDGRVRIMEWNGEHNDIKFSEATQGPCFADMGWESLWRAA